MNNELIITENEAHTEHDNSSPFIEANTEKLELETIQREHIIPVFIKDNEPVISTPEFIDIAVGVTHHVFSGEHVIEPNIRVSHPIKGRIPEAKHKSASELLDHERTIYYERTAFVIQIPSISKTVNGNTLALTVGGIKAYNLDNLNRSKGAPEHFKIFVGFLNKVCTNLCVWNEGFCKTVKVSTPRQLEVAIFEMVTEFCDSGYFEKFGFWDQLGELELGEQQFANLIGRAKMYQQLPKAARDKLPDFLLNDSQISSITKEYYSNPNFGNPRGGSISLWNLYNLFTESNKSSYIDTFLDRGLNAHQFMSQLTSALVEEKEFWFLN
ncbi:MAG: DUF3871 family protein [Gracilimonas sp.]|uniref:DUF3871 family protein n=1 Tax=Gracilimonas sp. TaxID=1974203 RepID=UPI00199A2B57|nr:DUF3871 family protein [Gracilimonas sp.]MBD3615357.1 DUF3871 family protein [Gracilimonas sp.]